MSHNAWTRHEDEELAADKLLDAAGRAFAEFGVAKATMMDVARLAGCSRATLYRYFPNQDALRLAFVHRATLRIAAQMAEDSRDGIGRTLADRIEEGVAQVRRDPMLSIWFEPENMAVPIMVSQSSELLQTLSAGAVDETTDSPSERSDVELRGQWLLRSIISLLAMPGQDAASERAMIDRFIVPVLSQEPTELEQPTERSKT